MGIPADIFDEPDIDPDTIANLGPLRRLAGIWEGKRGHDINPKGDGPEHREYYERIELQPIDAQPNGPQLFYGLRYHVHITRPKNRSRFTIRSDTGCGSRRPASSCRQWRSRAGR